MKPERQRIAIAEACGWKRNPSISGCWDDPIGFIHADLPNYLNDLNAMRKAENKLNNSIDSKLYGQWLVRITQGFDIISKDAICLNYWALMSVARAKAAQRAEAFLRTIGKWKE